MRLIDSCITHLKAQGHSRTCDESKGEEEEEEALFLSLSLSFALSLSRSLALALSLSLVRNTWARRHSLVGGQRIERGEISPDHLIGKSDWRCVQGAVT